MLDTLSEEALRLCAHQARLFELSHDNSSCGSAVFIRRFMYSDMARRMDECASVLEVAGDEELVRLVDMEYGGGGYGSQRYSVDELHWMGYLYRYWCSATKQSSKSVYRTIGATELRGLYAPYHTMDVSQAIERIVEAKGLGDESDELDRAVRIMREVRSRRKAAAGRKRS